MARRLVTRLVDDHHAEAWRLARKIADEHPCDTWPDLPPSIPPALAADVRKLANEAFLYGVFLASASMEAEASLDGVTCHFPAGYPYTDAVRHMSWEALLPFIGRDVSRRDAELLAARFRGLAAVCEARAKRS